MSSIQPLSDSILIFTLLKFILYLQKADLWSVGVILYAQVSSCSQLRALAIIILKHR